MSSDQEQSFVIISKAAPAEGDILTVVAPMDMALLNGERVQCRCSAPVSAERMIEANRDSTLRGNGPIYDDKAIQRAREFIVKSNTYTVKSCDALDVADEWFIVASPS